jgi:UDP-GlcNAc:undecaprenyl-phosphate GlcNAc-1-phosphate transferase
MMPLERKSYWACLALFALLVLPFVRGLFTYWGLRWAYVLGFSFSLAYILTPVVRSAAEAMEVYDVPDTRKVHTRPTPLLGGVAIYVAFISSVFANYILTPQVKGILLGGTIVVVLGLLDDVIGLRSRTKLLIQLVATGVVMAGGVSLILVPQAWPGSTLVNGLLTVLWIVGITNAMNFFDGMDGLAPGLAIIISFFLGLLAFQTHQPFLGWLALAVMGASFGFLPYNFRFQGPATIFLGDTGSTFLGFILACLAVLGEWSEANPIVSLSAPILIFGVLIFDMVYLTVTRFYTGKVSSLREWLEYTGRDHLHHRLAEVLRTPRQSVLFIFLLASCLGLASTVLRNAQTRDALLLIVQAVAILLLVTVLESVGRWKEKAGEPKRIPKPSSSGGPSEAEGKEE